MYQNESEFSKIDKDREFTVVQQAMEQIQNLIVTGHYKPGDRLPTEMELASRFGISRSSLREAIKVFNYLDILESRVAKGTFVGEQAQFSGEAISMYAVLSQKNMYEIMEFFSSILLWSSSTLAVHYERDPEAYGHCISDLDGVLSKLKTVCDLGNLPSVDSCICKLHEIIMASSGNQVLVTLTKTLHLFNSHINRTVQANLYSRNEVTYNAYSALVSAIKNNDTQRIFQIVQDILAIQKDRIAMPLPPEP